MSSLNKIFLIKEGPSRLGKGSSLGGVNRLGQKQEKIVIDFSKKITDALEQGVHANSDIVVRDILRAALVASERAEGEPASDLDEGIDWSQADMSQEDAKMWIERTGGDFQKFVSERGSKPKYQVADVLEWLGM